MNALICLAFVAVVHAVPLLNQQVGDIPRIPIPYEMLRHGLQQSESNEYNTIQVKNLNELRGGNNDGVEESNLDSAIFDELTSDDIETAIRIAAALEYVILRDVSFEDPALNAESVSNAVNVVHNAEKPESVIVPGGDVQTKDLNLKRVVATDPSEVTFVNVASDDEVENPQLRQLRFFN